MKRILSLVLTLAILLTLVLPAIPVNVEAATASRYSVLVLDVSGSETFTSNWTTIYEADTAVEYVKSAAVSFLKDAISADGENLVALITYDDTAHVVSDFTNNLSQLTKEVDAIEQSSSRDRSIASALEAAEQLLESVEDPNATRNLVLFTTGMTDIGESDYSGHYGKDTIGSNWYNTGTGIHLYAYANIAYNVAERIKANDITIYSLGLFQTMAQMPEAGKDIANFFKMTARDLASSDDCFYDVSDPSDLEFAFSQIAGSINVTSGKFKYAGSINKETDSEADYFYSDGYFMKRASLYNASLATMSLCLELSCWSSHDAPDWYKPTLTPEDDDYWNDKLVNVKTLLLGQPELGAGYEGLGFSHFEANKYWEAAPTKESIGVCFARKTIQSGSNSYTLVAVVIRGGGYGSEWGSNFLIDEDGNHAGFEKARDDVLKELQKYINGLNSTESQNLKLWIVGYSRAGATANMVAGKLNEDPYYLGHELDQENIYCYTFEAPQGVLRENMTTQYRNIHNVLNANDLVPLVAPTTWGFYRYNYTNTRYLPTRYTTDEAAFQEQKEAMEQQLELLGYPNYYKIEEIINQADLHIDKSNFLPFGEPLWWWTDSQTDTHLVIQDGIDFIATDVIEDRAYYVENLQYTLSNALAIICHYDGAAAGLEDYAKGLFDPEAFLKKLDEFFTIDNIMYVLAPMFSLNPFKSFEERKDEVTERTMKKLGSIFEAYAEVDGCLEAIGEILVNIVLQLAGEVWNNNTDTINLTLKFVNYFTTNGFDGHSPEICLAWCRSLDANYNSDVAAGTNCSTTRLVVINCPVDVYVYNRNGEAVASIVDDKADESSLLVCYVNSNGEKIVYLPGESQYSIQLVATDDGTVDCSIGELSLIYSGFVRVENYYDLQVSDGDQITLNVEAASRDSLEENSSNGTDATYSLYLNGRHYNSHQQLLGLDAAEQKYTLTISVDGNGGYANGAGSFTPGRFAQVQAYTLPGGQFEGWYDEDGNLLSTEEIYRLSIRDNRTLTAKFNEITISKLTLDSTKGGQVVGYSDYYAEGTQISLEAIPDKGYEFVGWTTSSGKLSSKTSTQTILTMSGKDTKVVAEFRRIGATNSASDSASNLENIIILSLIGLTVLILGVVIIVIAVSIKRTHKRRNK